MQPNTSTPAQYMLILIDLVESQGHSRSELLRGTSLERTGISGIGARVSDIDFNHIVQNAFALTQDSALGLKLGLRLNLGAHAVLGQAFMTCKDLAEVIDLFLSYYHLLSPSLNLEYEQREQRCFLTVLSTPEETPIEFGCELLYGGILNTLRGILNTPDLKLRIEMPYPEPAHGQLYREIFGDDVHFNAVRPRVSYDESLMSTLVPSSNPALRALYEDECARLLSDLERNSISEQTLQLLRKLEGQYPQMPQLAKMLNYSPRTYRRRLEQEQESYQTLLDQVRAEHATRYLMNTQLPLSTIAYMIGFNDASNFRRAYIRWTGQAPRDVRLANRQSGSL